MSVNNKDLEQLPLLDREDVFDHSRYAIYIVVINLGLNFAYVLRFVSPLNRENLTSLFFPFCFSPGCTAIKTSCPRTFPATWTCQALR